MNDQDRTLIQEVLKAAGKAGEQGFQYLVNFTFSEGVVEVFAYAAWAATAFFVGKMLRAWKPEEFEAHISRGLGLLACAVFFAVCIGGISNSIVKILQPAGAAIHSVLNR